MLEYFFNVKKRNVAHRRKFVVVSTTLSFLLILGIWIPFQVMRFRLMANKATVAENKIEEASPSPLVAGDATTKSEENKPNQPNLPFLSGSKINSNISATPSSSPELMPTITPDLEEDTPLMVESSPEPVLASPAASDFPTL